MKFGERLKEEMLQEWAQFYIDYEHMKEIIGDPTLGNDDFVTAILAQLRLQLERAEKHVEEMVDQLQSHFEELTKNSTNNAFHQVVTAAHSPTQNGTGRSIFPRKFINQGSQSENPFDHNQPASSNALRGTSTNTSASNLAPITSYGGTAAEKPGSHTVHINNQQSENDILVLSSTEGRNGSMSSSIKKRPTAFQKVASLFQGPAEVLGVAESARRRYAEWYSSATRLIHFAELNIETMAKTVKKADKVRPFAKIKARFASEIQYNKLRDNIVKIHEMMEQVRNDFQGRFGEEIKQYADVSMTEVWECKWRFIILSIILYAIARAAPIFTSHPPAHHCFALFVVVVTLWITEAMPFFCTAMLIPLIAVPTGILKDPVTGGVADAEIASKVMMGRIFDHVQILVLGGLVIAKAMSRTHLEFSVAAFLHTKTAHSPKAYLLGVMFLSCFMSMFVSNVASPLLTLGVIHSTLWEFPSGSKAPHGILLALAFSCNIGGMLSPIASPQNAVAMQVLNSDDITFAKWVLATLPLAIIGVLSAWVIILWLWKPFEHVDSIPLQNAPHGDPVPRIHTHIVVITTVVTVTLWCLPPATFFGDAGVVALIPIVVLFGSGVLKKDDFNKLSWHLMFLLAGGNMLGTCARDSKMLDLFAASVRGRLESESAYLTLVIILLTVVAVTTFVSHTVAAMILLPIIAKVGTFLPHPSASDNALLVITPELLVFLSALMCSAAMAFPISSFPNVNSLLAEDDTGHPYLRARDFLVPGTLVTIVLTLGGATLMIPWFNLIA